MKSLRAISLLIIGTILMTACAGGVGNDIGDEMRGGFEVSEEEAIDLLPIERI